MTTRGGSPILTRKRRGRASLGALDGGRRRCDCGARLKGRRLAAAKERLESLASQPVVQDAGRDLLARYNESLIQNGVAFAYGTAERAKQD